MSLPRLPIATALITIGIAALLALPASAATKAKPKAEAKADTAKLFTLTSPTLKDDVDAAAEIRRQ